MPLTLSFLGPDGPRLGKFGPAKFESGLAIVGSPERTSIAARRIGGMSNGFRIEVFSDRAGPGEKAGQGETDIDRLTTLVSSGHIGRVLLATPVEEQERIAAVVRQLEGIVADVGLIVLEGVSTDMRLGGLGDVCIAPVLKRPLTPFQEFVKSAVDRVCALLLLLLIAPLLLSIALVVGLTSRGPILFRQQRRGLNNKTFEVLKFRTLYNSCADPNAWQPVERHDKRVTSIGKVLRALSLDELPQLVNVLKGDMSLIGPRPLPVDLKVEGRLCSEFPRYRARHRVRPGITGLAQVKGSRGGMEVTEQLQERIAYDLEYINNYSLLLDAKIAIATVYVVLGRSNAY
jgi:exopolysaccharide biosynthesis polyprenyl glycosylphosphotransferase